jgi:hypothetical protein
LKYALNKKSQKPKDSDSDENDADYKKFGSKKNAQEDKLKRKNDLEELKK